MNTLDKGYFIRFLMLFVFCLLAKLEWVEAQDTTNTIGKVSISAPTAASLGKYGDIPVSYHTGIPNISIPIYTIKSGNLSLPISMSYHASGLKVQELASWVGTGWSLNAGGVITRTVKGGADDRGYSGYQGYTNACLKGHYSDYGFNSNLISGTDSTKYDTQIALADRDFSYGYADGEPDLFTGNFGGYNIKFYFNDDHTPVLVPEQDMNIQADFQLGPGFNGFIITTPDGTKYYFGRTGNYSSAADPVESTIPSTISNGPNFANAAASSWFLNKIVSADQMDSITFQYQAESYSYYTWSMFPVLNGPRSGSNTTLASVNGVDLVKNIINGVRLSKISFSNGSVMFTPSSTPRIDLSSGSWVNMTDNNNTSAFSLGSIQISDNTGFCKKDSLYYHYFTDNTTGFSNTFYGTNLDNYNLHSDRNLLSLDSIQEYSCDQTIKNPPYKFAYFSEFVPRRLSFGIDHWGFYNGVDNNPGLIPTYIQKDINGVISQVRGANRDAAWPAMRGGALQQITYPTGGQTVFEFEANNTNLNYNTYSSTQRYSFTVGYTIPSPLVQNITLSGNSYELIITNAYDPVNNPANFQIYNSSNVGVFNSGQTPPGKNDTIRFAFPAGNYTIYFYRQTSGSGTGANAFLNEMVPQTVNGNVIVGGLRIKSISNKDAVSGANIVTNYSYNYANNPNGNSSGILYSRPNYVQWIRNTVFEMIYGIHPLCDYPTLYKSPASIRPMENTQGNHIGYNEVYVSQANNGYSIYRYYGSSVWDYNLNDVCIRYVDATAACGRDVPNFPAAPVPFEYKRGELKYEEHDNQSGKMISSSWYFPSYASDPVITPGHNASVTLPNGIYSYTEYNLQSAYKIRDSVSSAIVDQSGNQYINVVNTTSYNSAYHHSPTSKRTFNSTGDSLLTKYVYAYDFRPSNFTIPDSLNYFLNRFYSDSVTLFNNLNGCPASDFTPPVSYNNCHHTVFVQFRAHIANDRMNYAAYRRRTFTDPGNLYASAHFTAKNNAGAELRPIFELQDAFENPVIEQSQWKNANLVHANFTRYDYMTSPTGSVYPNKTQLINLSALSPSFTNAAVSTNTLTKDTRYQDETVYSFYNGNPQTVTARDGLSNSFIWDYKHMQPVCKVNNASIGLIAYTSFEAEGTGGWTVGSGLRDNTGGITGSQAYNLLNGAVSKTGLDATKTYVVSYWSKSGAYNVNSILAASGRSVNGWTYYEHRVASPGGGSVTVTGSGLIDELRLYPINAQMTSYTYSPLLGMTSQCDPNNRVSYYEYDALGRLKDIKDQDGNIIKTVNYHYQGQ
jgi:YD repeat-containing protein